MGGVTNSNKEPPKTQKEIVREQTRTLDRASRKIEREIKNLQRQEAKQLKEVEKLAKQGQHGPAKTVAKSVATTNWAQAVLSPQQVAYAAHDAHAALRVYRALTGPPVPSATATAKPLPRQS